jgi:phosphohistidine swiveling domain-containing protein
MKWIKHWAGGWSILTSTYLGEQYTRLLKETLGKALDLTLFISKKGFTVCSLEKEDHKRFGAEIAQRIVFDDNKAKEFSDELKAKTDNVLKLIKELENKRIEKSDFFRFIKAMLDYGSPHRAVKIAVDFLPEKILKKHLPILSKARVYAEPVYEQTEKFMQRFALQICKEIRYAPELILAMTKNEFEVFLEEGKLPDKNILEERFQAAAIFFESGKFNILKGKNVEELEKQIEANINRQNVIKGTSAFPGKVKGKVRIIFDPLKEHRFEKGDILVAGMTRPEFTPFIEKASAIVTDAGGVLCHAAITAREMQKPCIVGTDKATKVFKDGDLVEVDAEKGIVKIIK